MLDYMIMMMKSIPVKSRAVVKENKSYKVYLPVDMDDVWEGINKSRSKIDIVILIPRIDREDKPELLKFVNKIFLRKRRVTREYKRYKIYLPHKYNDVWSYLNKNNIKVDLILILPTPTLKNNNSL